VHCSHSPPCRHLSPEKRAACELQFDKDEVAGWTKGESKGQAESDLADADKQLKNDNAALEDTRNNCRQTSANYEGRVKAREEELSSINEAIQILANPEFLQADERASLLQVKDNEDVREQVSNILQAASDKYNSAAFAQLASRTRVGDAFGKVKGLIEDMIAKLQKQAIEEANKKAYCDTEKKKGEAEREKLSRRSDLLQTRDDKYSADITKLKEEVAGLAKEIAEIAESVEVSSRKEPLPQRSLVALPTSSLTRL